MTHEPRRYTAEEVQEIFLAEARYFEAEAEGGPVEVYRTLAEKYRYAAQHFKNAALSWELGRDAD